VLDKEWENKSLEEILKAPVSALAGVSDTAAAAWQQAFNVKTVGDLGRNKFFRAAQALALLAESTGKQ
jgi:phage terminase Nu1 subunit (DNA packaging protein)